MGIPMNLNQKIPEGIYERHREKEITGQDRAKKLRKMHIQDISFRQVWM